GYPQAIGDIDAVGIKLINAGKEITATQPITREVLQALQEFAGVTGIHNPPAIATIRLFEQMFPEIPLIGVFETGFHHNVPEPHRTYGIPEHLARRYGIEKLGFHGNSHRHSARRLKTLAPGARKIISCHLGSGSSICAVLDGRSFDISSGFTPQSGTIMSTRPGDIDAQVLTYLQEKAGLSWSELNRMLLTDSGLLGISGTSAEMWELEHFADKGDERARLAIAVFVYQVKKHIGAYFALMNGLEALSFTGGIGENDPKAREAICRNLESLGIVIDPTVNEVALGQEALISSTRSLVPVWVIPADEESLVAEETYAFLLGKNVPS
ncbi:MAG TPA: hypothetical protein VLH40_08045, partial [Atribacteraceae bacterium]|nr:hypothetical protein [Atribacteraceae bacterium]